MGEFPFEFEFDVLQARLDEFVSVVFSSLESEFLILPKGDGFVEYSVFETGYEALKRATSGFATLDPEVVFRTVRETPIALIVLRTMLGFTPPEWGYMATQRTGVEVPQGAARSLDRNIRIAPLKAISKGETTRARVKALVEVACLLLVEGAPNVGSERIHRMNKADTRGGSGDLQTMTQLGVPYPMLLYERFLGRPFAGHKDSVSELVGDSLEVRIEEALVAAGVSYRKTKRAERVPGFDQAPDFIIPDEFNPQIVIEAKIAEDDGTARDKITRVQHLAHLSARNRTSGSYEYEVVACIGGRGFGIRREDMKKLLLATRGKVFTLKTLPRLLECTKLRQYKTQ
ncbi:MAG: hypothetical protein HY763_12715 [Planctomycetes bacterium]|nr:hypothetical protein [Planctomycetota bacterium]